MVPVLPFGDCGTFGKLPKLPVPQFSVYSECDDNIPINSIGLLLNELIRYVPPFGQCLAFSKFNIGLCKCELFFFNVDWEQKR